MCSCWHCRVYPPWAAIVGQPRSSIIICRVQFGQDISQLWQESTMWDIICSSPQAHRSELACCHLFWKASQWPCTVRTIKETETPMSSREAVRLWGQPLRGSWPPKPNSSLSSTLLWCLLDNNLAMVDSWMTVAVVPDNSNTSTQNFNRRLSHESGAYSCRLCSSFNENP